MTIKCKDANFKIGALPMEYLLRGLARKISSMSSMEIVVLINDGMAAEDAGMLLPAPQFSPEELDLIMHAAHVARQCHGLDKALAAEEGDYSTAGQMDDMAERLWKLIAKIKTSRR